MRHCLWSAVPVVATVLLFQPHLDAAEPAGKRERRPNVLLIVGDDMGYADVGFHGCKDIPTPHLDALARDGVRFSNGYVSGPYCSPTRAGLLTGRYQQRFGHEFNPGGGQGLPLSEKTLADRLQAAGYSTGLVGKWHLGAGAAHQPLQRGFQEFFGFLGGAHGYFPDREGGKTILRGTAPAKEKAYLTDAFAREAVAFIERHRAKPWFLFLAFNAVHTPMHADDARLARFAAIADPKRRTYAAMMSAMDDAIGQVMQTLRKSGLDEQTLVVFHSDNGGPTMPTTTVNGSINRPLRGSKRQTLEGGVRVPFVLRWKGKLPEGKVYAQPVIQLDVVPTALAAADIAATPADRFDGVDLLPYLRGEKQGAPHETLYWRFGEQMAIRQGDWKLVRYGANTRVAPDEKWPKLYHLGKDIGEATDLSADHPDKVRELEAAWRRWDAGLVRPLWGGGIGRKKKG